MKLKPILAAATILALSASAGAASAAVLLSDNFNADPQMLNWTGDATFASTAAPGSVDLIGTGFFDFYPGHGNYLDLDGSTGSGHDPAGQITSLAAFGPGTYSLSFLLGGNARGVPDRTTLISLGDFSTSITLASADPLALHTFSFTTTTGGNLVFTQTGPSNNQGNILDDILLSTAVPEPTSWALMLTGFLGMGAALRRRPRAPTGLTAA